MTAAKNVSARKPSWLANIRSADMSSNRGWRPAFSSFGAAAAVAQDAKSLLYSHEAVAILARSVPFKFIA